MRPLPLCVGLIVFLMIIGIACTTDEIAGTGHEGEANVMGTVYDSLGNGVKELKVELLPSDYNPKALQVQRNSYSGPGNKKDRSSLHEESNLLSFTDDSGKFTFENVPEGSYTLLGGDIFSSKVVYHPSITITMALSDVTIGPDTLKRPGSIVVAIPKSLVTSDCYVYIPGTNYYKKVYSSGVLVIDAPAGNVDVAYFDKTGQVSDTTKVLVNNAIIPEGSLVDSSKSISTPSVYSTADSAYGGESIGFNAKGSVSNNSDTIEYRFDWDDGSYSNWIRAHSYVNILTGDTIQFIADSIVMDSHSWDETGTYQVRAQARSEQNNVLVSSWSASWTVSVTAIQDSVSGPSIAYGDSTIRIGSAGEFIADGAYCSDTSHSVEYRFDWGNSTFSSWISGSSGLDTLAVIDTHSWDSPDIYAVCTQARCKTHPSVVSGWSDIFNVEVYDPLNDTSEVSFPYLYGDSTAIVGIETICITGGSVCKNGDPVEFLYDWGDFSNDTNWISYDTVVIDTHTFQNEGVFAVRTRARSILNPSLISTWSDRYYVTVIDAVPDTIGTPRPPIGLSDSVPVGYLSPYMSGGLNTWPEVSTEIRFDWGDGTISSWSTDTTGEHSWSSIGEYAVRAQGRLIAKPSVVSDWSDPFYIHVYDSINDTSSIKIPRVPFGPDAIPENYQAEYVTGGSHIWPVYDAEYRFDWGNGTYSSWSIDTTRSYSWSKGGAYFVRAQARKLNNPSNLSGWSDAFIVTISADTTSGDTVTMPQIPAGLTIVQSSIPYLYQSGGSIFITSDSIARTVEYRFSWGDGTMSAWSTDTTALHAWDLHYVRTLDDSIYVRAQARSAFYTWVVSAWSEPLLVSVIDTVNDTLSVSTPGIIGPEIMPVNHSSFFRPFGSVCSNGDSVEYRFIWGDSTFSTWHMFSDTALSEEHSWSSIGSYPVRAQARSAVNNNYISDWSAPLTVPVEASVLDTVSPILGINGPNPMSLSLGTNYTEYGITGWDNVDGDITCFVSIEGTVNTSTAGTYTVIYKLSDSSANQVEVARSVVVGK